MNLGLKKGSQVQFVLCVNIDDLVKARNEWARVTGHLDPNWNEKQGTYSGFPVVKTKKEALTRKGKHSSPYYY